MNKCLSDNEEVRTMRCPFCGSRQKTGGIGRMYCGPHKVSDSYWPAVQMVEDYDEHEREDE